MISESEYIKSIGKNDTFFQVIRYRNDLLCRYIRFIGRGNFVNGYNSYTTKAFELKQKLIELLEDIDDKIIADTMVNEGIYKVRASALYFLRTSIYLSSIDMRSFKNARKAIKIVNDYNIRR